MAKTGKEVQSDVLALLRDSDLASMISGRIYRNGTRPRDSKLEDAIVTFTTGLADEIETGIVTINIYLPDIDPFANGVLLEDGQRSEEIEIAAQRWVDSLTASVSNYKFSLQQAIYTEEDQEINQHFVVIKLKYKLFNH